MTVFKLRLRIEEMLKSLFGRLASSSLMGHAVAFLPIRPDKNTYTLPLAPARLRNAAQLPLPPQRLWLGYGPTAELYLDSGRRHVEAMRAILNDAGFAFAPGVRVLDFGCGAGRMTRWLADVATTCEIWGTDISAEHVAWCDLHLNPPFNFVTTTTLPHLPFEDRTFDLIYAGSVFSHIDDLAKTWLLELRRVLRPGGMLYITVLEKHSIDVLPKKMREPWLLAYLEAHKEYQAFRTSGSGMLTIGRALRAQVFYDVDFLRHLVRSAYRVVSINREAYGYQTAVLLQKLD
jgi:ubiquinone/menaquinone biosynthesis C-methylase UbiE